MISLIEKLEHQRTLSPSEFTRLLENRSDAAANALFERAVNARKKYYGNDVYIRGLIEFTNYCKNDCYYCGIRRSNKTVGRYRLSREDILLCCERGYEMGYRTFVLQGGEDGWYTPQRIEAVVADIKSRYPDCAVTLSVGEQPPEVYRCWFDAGADRYLLRHETADECHYAMLHPPELSLEHRKSCLYSLKEIGYQVGCGFMVGSPGQETAHIVKDLLFIREFEPDMVGIGPFIPHHATPFKDEPQGSLELTLYLLAIVRLMLPNVLLPATTALGSIHPRGREKGILAGANVCMPNLSPENVRGNYSLYDNKLFTGAEAALNKGDLQRRMEAIGYNIVTARGDCKKL